MVWFDFDGAVMVDDAAIHHQTIVWFNFDLVPDNKYTIDLKTQLSTDGSLYSRVSTTVQSPARVFAGQSLTQQLGHSMVLFLGLCRINKSQDKPHKDSNTAYSHLS